MIRAGTALVYCRVSTRGQEQDGTSLDSQEEQCRAHAAELGYEVRRVYREAYSGAELFDRPELNALRDAVRAGGIDAVLVYAVDRLTRKQGLTAFLLADFERYGTALVSVTDPLEATKEGKLILGIKEYVAEVEREKIRDRTLRGKRAKVAEGKLCHGSMPLYGYRIDPETRTRVIHQPEAAIVRTIFERAAQGVGVRRIARQLTADGIPPRARGKIKYREEGRQRRMPSGGWEHKCVCDILGNPAYKGETIYLGQTLPEGVTPPIVSAELWQDAQVRNLPNASKQADATRNETHPHLLRGLVQCAVCGTRMAPSYVASHGRNGQLYPGHYYYQCGSRATARGSCGARAVRADLVEPWIWERAERILRDPAIITRELDRQRGAGPDQSAQEEIEAARRQLAEIERQQKRLLELYAVADDALPVDLLKVQMGELKKQATFWEQTRDRAEQRLRQQEETLAGLENLTSYCRRVAAGLERFGFKEKRLALEALGTRVTASGREWRMDCRLPLDDAQPIPEHFC